MTSSAPDGRKRSGSPIQPDWLDLGDAVRRVVGGVPVLDTEEIDLRDGLHRTLATDLKAPVDVPRWTNSAMDGFAVRAADIAGVSESSAAELPVVDDIAAGGFPRMPLPPGSAARIMTGAAVPEGADSVIRVEHTDGGIGMGSAEARVRIFDGQDAGRNLRHRGEDLQQGQVALRKGMLLAPGAIGVAASLGFAKLPVFRRPMVALLTSGDELVEIEGFEEVLAGRKIVSSNSYTLAAQLREAGAEVRYLGIAADTPESLRSALNGARGCDALVTSAGISVGEHDHVRGALDELRTEVDFWRVKIRPGSPFAFGRVGGLGGIPWFGLPGNPVSSMVTFEIFVRPALLRMAGRPSVFPATLRARLLEDVPAQPGLTTFVRVHLERQSDSGWGARTTGAQGSGVLSSLANADGMLIVPAGTGGAERDEMVDVIPLDPSRRLTVSEPQY